MGNITSDKYIVKDGVLIKWLSTDERHVTVPSSINIIGEAAFAHNHTIETINLPNSIYKIDWSAFSNCSNLQQINIPEYVTELKGTFTNCHNLSAISLPETLKTIGAFTFGWCRNLRNINIPNQVDYIGVSAFSGCSGLTNIILPKNLSYLCDTAFTNCSNLREIRFQNPPTHWGKNIFDGNGTIRMPAGTHIGANAFYNQNVPYGQKIVYDDTEFDNDQVLQILKTWAQSDPDKLRAFINKIQQDARLQKLLVESCLHHNTRQR